MGEPWMMFTKDQGYELIYGTISEWTTISSKNGRKFISTRDSSKYIFLPAGGDMYSTVHNGSGWYGRYWSRTYYDSTDAYYLRTDDDFLIIDSDDRYCGKSIRAVRPKQW